MHFHKMGDFYILRGITSLIWIHVYRLEEHTGNVDSEPLYYITELLIHISAKNNLTIIM